MGETSQPSSSRVRLRNNAAAAGEIVKVQGGHIVRSTGRKDRHSKVCTAKGPRDRRVRLAAHTAIQFYDVQDRLGYDRPSKAVDWLINKAKSAIDELEQLPPWHPTATCNSAPNPGFEQGEADLGISSISEPSSKRAMTMAGPNNSPQPSSFLPPSLDSDAIADTIKSFFPMGASAEANSSADMQFHNFPIPDLPSRNSANTQQDLRLSLQSFQDPNSLHHHHHHHSDQTHSQTHIQSQVLLSGIPLGFDGTTAGWAEQQHHQAAELGRFQRHSSWNGGGGDSVSGSGGGYLFNSPPQPTLQQLLGQNQFLSQRGPLQSSNTPSIRAWMDPSAIAISTADHGQLYHHQFPSSISGVGFSSGLGAFSGFHIPARIQGDEEEHDGYPDKPSSASSDSRH